MRFQELVILLPCHSLEDFPVYSEGQEAQGLLAAWTALWHPALIHSAQSMPTWSRMDDPPAEIDGRLLLIPPVSHTELPTGFFQRVKEGGGCPIRKKDTREEILEIALDSLDDAPSFADEWIKDFFALSFAYLQVQILTRQMRYSSNLDEVHFANQVVAAVNAAAEGDEALAEQKLTACFDLLSEERDLFYSVDSFLVDLVLLAPTTLGKGLQAELASRSPVNFLLTAGVLEALSLPEHAEVREALATAWSEGRIGIFACDEGELPLPLLPMEAMAGAVQRGRDSVQRVLRSAPKSFGRRRYGLTPQLPQTLRKLGIPHALHATFEEGRFPEGAQIKSLWEGADGSTVDAIAKAPLDASQPETFLGFALKTGESMDMDHVATLTIAHWPGAGSPFLEDLRRAARRTTALGKFVTIDEYFSETDEPHHGERFPPSLARSPYLRQAIIRRQPGPLSRWAHYQKIRVTWSTAQALDLIAAAVEGRRNQFDPQQQLLAADMECESASEERLQEMLQEASLAAASAAQRAAASLRAPAGAGRLVWNPHTSARRAVVSLQGFPSLPEQGGPIYAIDDGPHGPQAVVDVPPMGYTHVLPGGGQPDRRAPQLVDGIQLRNDFFEVMINQKSGGIASIQSYNVRGNRMSQQLAMRVPGVAGERPAYSKMVCENLEVIESTRLVGVVRTRGRLVHNDETVANFEQSVRITRGSRVLEFEVELDNVQELKSDPWNCYVASRIAWRDEAAAIACDVNQCRQSMGDRKRMDACHYIDVRNGAEAVTVFPQGLPYHRRVGLASLDTLLVVRNETATKFKFALGIDVAYPLQESLALASPPFVVDGACGVPRSPTAWLFHLRAKNVAATQWRLLDDGNETGPARAFEVRLLETSGRAAQIKLQSLKPLKSAQIVDLDGNTLIECKVEEGAAMIEMSAHEWAIVRAEWA